ncbi:SpoIIE family protein phosphatase [Oceanicoccus sagamiensis]|uniref:SpoIIE family protein phosphatase n=1 Tax=Oceanicoccus sagamiensis TaxID=716816 RepID=UPI00146B1997|nr:SpoIIE family protein phosphatase [Oceanicoccus sagamiensis]
MFILLSYYEYSTAENFLRQQIKTKTHLAKSEMINRVDNLVHNVSDSVHTLAAVVSIEEVDKEKIQSMLERIVAEHQDIYGMAIALEPLSDASNDQGFAPYYYHQGDTVAYEDLSKASYDFRSKDWYTRPVSTGKDVWSEPYTDIGGGNIDMVTFSVPVYSAPPKSRQLLGVVTADISLQRLGKLVSKLGVGENGYAYIVSDQGNMITHSNPERVMTNVSDIPVLPENREKMQQLFTNMLAGNTDTLRAPCRAKTNSTNNVAQCWISYQPISATGWSIAIIVPLDELNKTLLQYRDNSILITITGLLLLTVIVILISRRLTIPLLSLTQSSRALARGELDTEIPEFDLQDEVGSLARQFKSMQISLKDYIEQLNQETAQRERLQGELGAAHDIQMQMLPDYGKSSVRQGCWHLSALLEPAKSVGGDFYHYQMLDHKTLFFAVGDVSDKGVAAALFMAKTQTMLRQLCVITPQLNDLLALINQQLCQDNDSCMFVTVLCGKLDTETGEMELASAGHSPPLKKAEDCDFVAMETGPALGFYDDAAFAVTTTTLALNNTLVLTTDGIDEAANPADEHYGEERLQQLIRTAHSSDNDELLALILNDVVKFRADAEPSDDLTIMTITRH